MSNNINTITIIGANGTLGKEISGIFASFGNAKVNMISRKLEDAEKAKKEAALSVKALAIEKNLNSKTFEDLEECIKESDLIFESVIEDIKIKKEIHLQISKYVKKDTIIATGTSGLSIDELAECYTEDVRKNFMGIHFFNPPYNLTLCELIPSRYTDSNSVEKMEEYLKNKLIRDVVIVKNMPAFLANRIGFNFMNKLLQLADEYKEKGGIDYIDAIFSGYTGRIMEPLKTVNFVGLDVHKAIVDNIYNKLNDGTYLLPQYVNELINDGKLGIKVGEGLYKKDVDGKNFVYDIKDKKYREKRNYSFEYKKEVIELFKIGNYKKGIDIIKSANTGESNLCLKMLLYYIAESLLISKEVSNNIYDCDIAMATGFNWIPPFALIEAFGGKEEVNILCEKYLDDYNKYKEVLSINHTSKYDYRKYLKAK